MEGCEIPCLKTASLNGPGGGLIMLSQPGNKKYPIPHTSHERCKSCQDRENAEMMADIQRLKDANALGPGMAEKWQQVQDKAKLVLDRSE